MWLASLAWFTFLPYTAQGHLSSPDCSQTCHSPASACCLLGLQVRGRHLSFCFIPAKAHLFPKALQDSLSLYIDGFREDWMSTKALSIYDLFILFSLL